MRTGRWRSLLRLELSLELALAALAVVAFDELRSSIDIGCGSSPTDLVDRTVAFVASSAWTPITIVAIAAVELRYELRPWVKRAVRLGLLASVVAGLSAFAVLARTFIRT